MSTLRLSKSLEQIRAELYARMEAVQDEYAAQGWLPQRLNLNKGIARGLIELFAWGLWQLYQLLEQVFQQAVPANATGDFLDLHAEQIELARKQATQARGTVTFHRAATSASGGTDTPNVRIPAGRIVRTLPDGRGMVYRYVTEADAVLPAGAGAVAVTARAEEYGAAANAAPGQIVELATPVPGIGAVSNAAGWLAEEGADAESDALLRRRYSLAWQARAGITSAAYKAAALSVTGVVDVYVDDQHPRGEGTVDVVVKGAAGQPTEQLLQAVRAAIATQIRINHDVVVKAPTPVGVDVAMELELLSGDADATVLAARAWVEALFKGDQPEVPAFGIGHDVVRDRMAAGIVSIAGVKRIGWASPVGDVDIPADGLATLTSLTVTARWVTEV